MTEEVFDLHAAVRDRRRHADEATKREAEERQNRMRGETLLALKVGLYPEEYEALLLELKPFDTRWRLNWHGVEYLLGIGLDERSRTQRPYIAASSDPNHCHWLNNGTDLLLWLSER
jgi:hypothetical protein